MALETALENSAEYPCSPTLLSFLRTDLEAGCGTRAPRLLPCAFREGASLSGGPPQAREVEVEMVKTEGITDLDEVHAISCAVYQVQASISALSIFGPVV